MFRCHIPSWGCYIISFLHLLKLMFISFMVCMNMCEQADPKFYLCYDKHVHCSNHKNTISNAIHNYIARIKNQLKYNTLKHLEPNLRRLKRKRYRILWYDSEQELSRQFDKKKLKDDHYLKARSPYAIDGQDGMTEVVALVDYQVSFITKV